MMVELVFAATLAGYAAASFLFFVQLVLPTGGERIARLAPMVLGIATALHASYVCWASLAVGVCPVGSIYFSASIAALAASLLFLLLRRRARIEALGAFVAPAALTFVLGSRLGAVHHRVGGGLLALHVTANILGDALFLLACASAVLYLVEERRLKSKRPAGLLGRLPPLDALDRAEHRFLLTGFPLLTFGIITGTLWAHRIEDGSAGDIARAAFALLTWGLFAAVLLLRAVAGWRGRRAAYVTIAGFVFAVAVLVVYIVRSFPGGTGGGTT